MSAFRPGDFAWHLLGTKVVRFHILAARSPTGELLAVRQPTFRAPTAKPEPLRAADLFATPGEARAEARRRRLHIAATASRAPAAAPAAENPVAAALGDGWFAECPA